MKNLLKAILTLSSIFMLSACTSNQEIISVSEAHYYNEQFGVNESQYADMQLEKEIIAMYQPPFEFETPMLVLEKGTFLEEDYVQSPEVITYKYKFDPKFYSHAEWRKMP